MILELKAKAIKHGLTLANVAFLTNIVGTFGTSFSKSCYAIGNELGMTYANAHYHLKMLERKGIIKIEHSSTRKLKCSVNESKVKEIMG